VTRILRTTSFMALALACACVEAGATGRICSRQAAAVKEKENKTLPRTPWGDPDLQGVWSGTGSLDVPLDRDAALGQRNVLTAEEFEARRARLVKSASSDNIEATNFGLPSEAGRSTSPQASLVVDPPDGRRPPRVPAAETRRPRRNSFVPGMFDSVSDLGIFDRCIAYSTIAVAFPVNPIEIVQAPGYVAIRAEIIHETRVIPLDGRSHAKPVLTSYAGDSRGRWEGKTLVVETTNFNGKTSFTGDAGPLTARLTIIERFTLIDPDRLSYEATFNDPETWTRPWTLAFPRARDVSGGLLEYAWHEGNYSLANILRASRVAAEQETK